MLNSYFIDDIVRGYLVKTPLKEQLKQIIAAILNYLMRPFSFLE
jgi:hypothetical protein